MECPKCQADLATVLVDEIEINRCVRCGGLWFDRREDTALMRDAPAAAAAIDTGPVWQSSMHNDQGKSFCPRDGSLMRRLAVPDRPGMWVERCPTCEGTYFDAGELAQLTEGEIGRLVRSSGAYRKP
jgi:Zn-finger nucleic acid-binding protein